jgi:hypothetical protein
MSIETLGKATSTLVKASDGNPATTTITVMLFWLMFNIAESQVEALIFGKRFAHWFDVVVAAAFILYAGYAVVGCAEWNSAKAARGRE